MIWPVSTSWLRRGYRENYFIRGRKIRGKLSLFKYIINTVLFFQFTNLISSYSWTIGLCGCWYHIYIIWLCLWISGCMFSDFLHPLCLFDFGKQGWNRHLEYNDTGIGNPIMEIIRLHNEISYNGKMASLYWTDPQNLAWTRMLIPAYAHKIVTKISTSTITIKHLHN